ncbi:hypothetical protein [Sphingobium sp.]|nr:hypothetical protein [Sphingobium sp.]
MCRRKLAIGFGMKAHGASKMQAETPDMLPTISDARANSQYMIAIQKIA